MQSHNLKREHPRKKARQVGRGGKRGKTAGRGTKGQLARAGHKLRPELRDIIKKLPKLRGYRFLSIQAPVITVTVGELEQHFASGAVVNPAALVEAGLARKTSRAVPRIKILQGGKLSKPLTLIGVTASAAAKEAVEKAGGKLS